MIPHFTQGHWELSQEELWENPLGMVFPSTLIQEMRAVSLQRRGRAVLAAGEGTALGVPPWGCSQLPDSPLWYSVPCPELRGDGGGIGLGVPTPPNMIPVPAESQCWTEAPETSTWGVAACPLLSARGCSLPPKDERGAGLTPWPFTLSCSSLPSSPSAPAAPSAARPEPQ